MKNFELTTEMMEKATTYMPISQKVILAEMVARKCLKPIKPLKEDDSIESFLVVPSVIGEDSYQKECMLLNVLLSHYFDIKVEKIDSKIYDQYMKGNLTNQLERYKSNSDYKTKAFDIITDFKTFKKMVDTEIYNLKAKENDILERFLKGVSLFSSEQMLKNPEYLKNITEELTKFVETAKSKTNVGEEETVEMEEE